MNKKLIYLLIGTCIFSFGFCAGAYIQEKHDSKNLKDIRYGLIDLGKQILGEEEFTKVLLDKKIL